MDHAAVEGEPELEADAVVVRVAIEDPELEDPGGLFVCRMRDFGDVSVERFLRDQAPGADARLRVLAAVTALQYAAENHDVFERLFATLGRNRDEGKSPSP